MNETVLVHHGIKSQKLGVRRYQNKDGTLTNMGRNRKTMNEVNDIGFELDESWIKYQYKNK
jgi:hypothetical protein